MGCVWRRGVWRGVFYPTLTRPTAQIYLCGKVLVLGGPHPPHTLLGLEILVENLELFEFGRGGASFYASRWLVSLRTASVPVVFALDLTWLCGAHPSKFRTLKTFAWRWREKKDHQRLLLLCQASAHVPFFPLGGRRRLHTERMSGRCLSVAFPDTVDVMQLRFSSRLPQVSET